MKMSTKRALRRHLKKLLFQTDAECFETKANQYSSLKWLMNDSEINIRNDCSAPCWLI